MSRMRKTAVLVLLLVLTVCCGRRSNVTPDETFRAQLEGDWKYWMAQYPEFATIAGYPGENARWTDYSQAAIDARAAYLRKSLERLASVDRGRLAAANQLNYDLYRELVQTAVDGLRFYNDAIPVRGVIPHNLMMPVNQLEGVQQDVPRVIGAMPAVTREDYENIVSRLLGIGPLIDQTIALLERGLAAQMTPPSIAVRDLPGQVAGQIVARSSPEPAARGLPAVARHGAGGRPSRPHGARGRGLRELRTSGISEAARFSRQTLSSGVPSVDRRKVPSGRRVDLCLQRPLAHNDVADTTADP